VSGSITAATSKRWAANYPDTRRYSPSTIDGHKLLVNNSRWGNFRTRRTVHWSTLEPRPVVLLGDAAHTAHFSVGSGTKMAMEDAIALADALTAHPGDLAAALTAYEAAARPSVDAIQAAARPSLSWWEHFGRYHDAFEPWQFAYHFLSRSITDGRLRRRDPAYVADTHRAWVSRHGAEPLETPLAAGGMTFSGRLLDEVPPGAARITAPTGEAGLPAALTQLREAVAGGAPLVAVHSGARFTRTLLCEEARLGLGVPVLLADPALDRDSATTAVLSGRADLIAGATP
jgi:salicyloyl-CoA 5-hydroxylase